MAVNPDYKLVLHTFRPITFTFTNSNKIYKSAETFNRPLYIIAFLTQSRCLGG